MSLAFKASTAHTRTPCITLGVRLPGLNTGTYCIDVHDQQIKMYTHKHKIKTGMNAEVIVDGHASCMPTSVSTIADRLQAAGWASVPFVLLTVPLACSPAFGLDSSPFGLFTMPLACSRCSSIHSNWLIWVFGDEQATSAYGKWDMGMTSWGCTPTCRGFDHFYGFYNAFNDYFTHKVGYPGFSVLCV